LSSAVCHHLFKSLYLGTVNNNGTGNSRLYTDFRFTHWMSAPPRGKEVTLNVLTVPALYLTKYTQILTSSVIDRDMWRYINVFLW